MNGSIDAEVVIDTSNDRLRIGFTDTTNTESAVEMESSAGMNVKIMRFAGDTHDDDIESARNNDNLDG